MTKLACINQPQTGGGVAFPFIALGFCLTLGAAFSSGSMSDEASAQSLSILRTGTGEATVSLSLSLQVPATSARLSFEFGFATDERPELGAFLDSFSLTLRTTDTVSTSLLLTSDESGVTWAPDSPPALALDPNSLDRNPIPFPSFGSALEKKLSS